MPKTSRLMTSGSTSLRRSPSAAAFRTSAERRSSICRRRSIADLSRSLLPRTRSRSVTAGRWSTRMRTAASTVARRRTELRSPFVAVDAASTAELSSSSASSSAAASSASLLAK